MNCYIVIKQKQAIEPDKRCEETLNTHYQGKEVNQKPLHAAQIQVCDRLERWVHCSGSKLIGGYQKSEGRLLEATEAFQG